jgi:hypothetical protein
VFGAIIALVGCHFGMTHAARDQRRQLHHANGGRDLDRILIADFFLTKVSIALFRWSDAVAKRARLASGFLAYLAASAGGTVAPACSSEDERPPP